ncbi:MAG TPA: hypothetical protein VFC00_10795 [Micromonosporaceae bacterium]|nr:hypothetical protein [Micromonosporaceae bacterium]
MRIPVPDRVALAIGAAGLGYRIVLVANDVPPANSDEGTTGLAALHIATGQDFPIFFYGQHYLGAIQAYLAAPWIAVFGTTWWALRIPPLILYGLFLTLMYLLTRRLYTPWFATATVALLALGSDRVVKNALIGGGGYPESSVLGVVLMLLALHLAAAAKARLVAFAGWGLAAGLVLWGHWLLLPYLLAAAGVLVAGCRRALLGWPGVAVVLGVLAGSAPLIGYNLRAPAGEDSWTVLLALNAAGGDAPLADRLYGGILVGLPLSTGMCPPGHCTPWQMWWGPVYLVLLVVAGVMAVRARQTGRLALLLAAALTLWLYVNSAGAAQTPTESARYLHYGLISLPAVLWPLWVARWRTAPVLAALAATMVVASGALVAAVPSYAAQAREERELVATLERLGVDRIYSEYWTCNRLTFVTRERIQCAVLDEQLHRGLDRYPPHAEAVALADQPAYVLPIDEPIDGTFAAYLAAQDVGVQIVTVGGYHIYRPAQKIGVPLVTHQ